VEPGDVVTKVDGKEIRRTRDLIDYVSSLAPGTNVRLEVIRNGKPMTLTAKTVERPLDGADAEVHNGGDSPVEPTREKIGIGVSELTPAIARTFGIPDDARGIAVTSVKEVSAAGEAGLLEGDLITQINGQPASTTAEFRRLVTQARSGEYLRMYVTRYGRGGRSQSFFAPVRVP
jgi:serine protease Do